MTAAGVFGSIPRPGSRQGGVRSTFKASKHQLSSLTKKNGSAVFGCFFFFKKTKEKQNSYNPYKEWVELLVSNREANSEVPKTCFLSFGQQEWLKLIAKRLKMSGGQYRKEKENCAFTNCFKKCLLV